MKKGCGKNGKKKGIYGKRVLFFAIRWAKVAAECVFTTSGGIWVVGTINLMLFCIVERKGCAILY